MAVPVVTIYLDVNNTNIVKDPVRYNVQIQVDLEDIWEELISEPQNIPYANINVQTYVSIPTLINNVSQTIYLSVINTFAVSSIQNKKVTQYGYFEGSYDESRLATATANVWYYVMIPA
ncbi:MAG: hypothetical protein ACRCTE_13770 [Cellulosilyticaceae bacterium]